MGKFSRSWKIIGASWRVLKQDKELLLFPVLSTIAVVLVVTSFVSPLLNPDFRQYSDSVSRADPVFWVALFAFYFVNTLIIIFFNSALMACAFKRMDGGDPTLGYGLRAARQRLPQILGWALLTSTVGLVLRAIEERVPLAGRLVVAILGAAWAVTSYLVVPVLVAEEKGPVDAYKRSVMLLKNSWGEQIIGNTGLGFIVLLVAVVPVFLVLVAGGATGSDAAMHTLFGLCVVYVIAVSLVVATLQSIYNAAIYRYAAYGETPAGFDQNLLAAAFRQKTRK